MRGLQPQRYAARGQHRQHVVCPHFVEISARGAGAEWVVMEAQPDELQLARLLDSPEALENLPSIISDIKARKAASLAHLSDNMAGQVCASYRSG